MEICVSEKFIEEWKQKLQAVNEMVSHRPQANKETDDYIFGYANGFLNASDMFLSLLSPLKG